MGSGVFCMPFDSFANNVFLAKGNEQQVDFFIHGYTKFKFFGSDVYLTTTQGGNFPLCLSAGAGQLRGNSDGVECAAGSKDRGEANAQCAVQAAGEVRGGTGSF